MFIFIYDRNHMKKIPRLELGIQTRYLRHFIAEYPPNGIVVKALVFGSDGTAFNPDSGGLSLLFTDFNEEQVPLLECLYG